MSHNRLANETSPYLLQHKDNPVDWWPWGEEAFAEAKRLNKPVLLSIGYAACHWCHVMAHESFEDLPTAIVMNELYVNIKVDREERPDVDALYMNALHAMGEQGGWPMTMFLTTDGEAFWGGTYFPKDQGYGRPGFTHVLREISRIYREEGEKIRSNADAVKAAIQPSASPAGVETDNLTAANLADFATRLSRALDPVNGGLVGAPKFPNCVILEYLWKMGLRHSLQPCADGVEQALIHMCQGGIYDHLGGGFARYTVDEHWLVPHFEKMLYDNALLIDLMTEVWKERRHALLETRITETVDWLLREMAAPDGGFASSYDADSEGEEGKYYVWSHEEVLKILGPEDGALFTSVYDISEDGNWENANIPNRLRSLELLSPAQEEKLSELRAKLLAVRTSRVAPGWDDKVLADWNGLLIGALVSASDAFGRKDWLQAATDAYRFVKSRMMSGERLIHSYRAGQAKTPAVASDYANMISAALRLYLATGETAKLQDAESWLSVINAQYWAEQGGYYLSAMDTRDIPIRTLSARDDATPNANAVMLGNLTALHMLTGNMQYRERADTLVKGLAGEALRLASMHTGFFSVLADHLEPHHIVLMKGNADEAMRQALNHISLPGAVVQWLDSSQAFPEASPAFGKQAIDGRTTAYICVGPQCSPPVTAASDLIAAIRSHHAA